MGSRVIALLFAATACGPVVTGNDGDTSTTGNTATTTENPTTSPSSSDPSNPTSLSTSGNPTTTTATATDPATSDPTTIDGSTSPDTCGDFVCPPDVIVEPETCDIWAQDCLRGERCMPWANDGGTHWNDTRCTPVDPAAVQPGDPCAVEGSPTSGIDNCDIGSMCFFVDPEMNLGTCVPFCMGNEDNVLCEDPSTSCAIDFDGVITTCLPACDPLLQDCAEGACHPTPDGNFVCTSTIGFGLGAGQTCGHEWECSPGYTCYDGAHVPDCAGDFCCAPFCDLTEPDQCEELTCDPWYRDDQGPGGEPPIGVCIIE